VARRVRVKVSHRGESIDALLCLAFRRPLSSLLPHSQSTALPFGLRCTQRAVDFAMTRYTSRHCAVFFFWVLFGRVVPLIFDFALPVESLQELDTDVDTSAVETHSATLMQKSAATAAARAATSLAAVSSGGVGSDTQDRLDDDNNGDDDDKTPTPTGMHRHSRTHTRPPTTDAGARGKGGAAGLDDPAVHARESAEGRGGGYQHVDDVDSHSGSVRATERVSTATSHAETPALAVQRRADAATTTVVNRRQRRRSKLPRPTAHTTRPSADAPSAGVSHSEHALDSC
jgi:hypothetical protein